MNELNTLHKKFISLAVDMALQNVASGKGGPFAALVVKDKNIVGKGTNLVTLTNDPTAHAEVVAIRDACKNLNNFQLSDCEIYCSCEPCPMCLGAIFWTRPKAVYFAASQADASGAGFDDSFIYEQLKIEHSQRSIPFIKIPTEDATTPFTCWKEKNDKIDY
ncbi:MAG: nucleoside deaminase [Bacteroidales bacterium]|jgi:guanine deaminase|nr:nucleoside deaminase [Bacteroidales bacterium]MDD4214421.1 nucleoside deaminase [Bacteroidales bacterium]